MDPRYGDSDEVHRSFTYNEVHLAGTAWYGVWMMFDGEVEVEDATIFGLMI